ncbi:MAG TPA: lytic transglycosylase domain-containing protein [Deltaproteobacteria bacterium]|nr:lytic transglycosylase domain-containing protein [Deltaproteobacteria bacterium]HQB39568.1 lytic transglycosylase domain-containing protein [Deltaproteobacteria bacterium]
MSITNIEQTSLIAALLEKRGRETVAAEVRQQGKFAEKLDNALDSGGRSVTVDPAAARSLAESLSLQMLRTTLSLSGEQPAVQSANPLADRHAAVIRNMIDAYASNRGPEASPQPDSAATPAQPLPEPDRVAPAVSVKTSVRQERGSQWLDPIISKASSRYGVDAALIRAVIKTESNFNPNAVSHAGAQGLMQLMPGTARSLGVADSFDPEQNVMGGTRFLRDLLNRYDGDLDSALAAYNWGPGNVDKRSGRMPRETREYLVRVKQLYSTYSA